MGDDSQPHPIFGNDPGNPPNLYKILDLSSRQATEAEVRSAYRKQALKYHPDKIAASLPDPEKLQARQKFDQIGLAYKILGDQKLRQRYDTTGQTDENSFLEGLDDEASWTAYFKDLWSGEVSAQTIEEFTRKYQGSQEELDDLHEHYLLFNGSLPEILSHTMCASNACEPRITQRIEQSIKDGLLPAKRTWEETKKDTKARAQRKRAAAKESKEAEELAKQLGVHDQLFGDQTGSKRSRSRKKNQDDPPSEDALKALIQANATQKHEALIAKLEAKALAESTTKQKNSQPSRRRKFVVEQDEEEEEEEEEDTPSTSRPTEDEFQRIQAELDARRKSNNKKKTDPKSNQDTRTSSSTTKGKKKKTKS